MKVLYIGSKADNQLTLQLEREVTDLQRRFRDAAGEPVDFRFLPHVFAEELSMEIAKERPDILHISTHSSRQTLSIANASGNDVDLTADTLAAFMPFDKAPGLVYLNSCDSGDIARKLIGTVPLAIGTSAPITNRAARASVVAFYSRILEGASVGHAFEVANKTISVLQNGNAGAVLHAAPGIVPDSHYLHRPPRIIASFYEHDTPPNKGPYCIQVGLWGCPANTTQVVFFTDDESFIDTESKSKYRAAMGHETRLATDLSFIVRGTPKRSVMWMSDSWWVADGDFRLFAIGITGDGTSFAVPMSLASEAILRRYRMTPGGVLPERVSKALGRLRMQDGSDLDMVPAATPRTPAPIENRE